MHITIKVLPRSARLRSTRRFRAIRQALIKGGLRFGFRLVHYSVQSTHLHLIGEAEDTLAVSRAIKGISVRIARRLNALSGRRGTVIRERYHMRLIRDRMQARRCVVYVLNNARRHAAQRGKRLSADYLDECSSARAFDGWSRRPDRRSAPGCPRDPCPDLPLGVHPAKSRLLVDGWRIGGAIDPALVPGPFPERELVSDLRP